MFGNLRRKLNMFSVRTVFLEIRLQVNYSLYTWLSVSVANILELKTIQPKIQSTTAAPSCPHVGWLFHRTAPGHVTLNRSSCDILNPESSYPQTRQPTLPQVSQVLLRTII